MAEPQPLTVSALTRRIQDELAGFGPLTVQGELSQTKVSTNGHFYATLKDREAIIPIVMWRTSLVRQDKRPQEGAQVVVRGSLEVYGPRGAYQLVCSRITEAGLGDLHARFLALKAKLDDEGLFAEDRKRPLPFLPRAVGVATASGSAALADILHSLRARFPAMRIVHAPCQVQGAGAAPSIIAALRRLERDPEVDVIIAGRGGGSIEDLWAFNEESVVRAIAASAVPVISAVGHETDTTLADFAADVRAKTPTAAGELAVPVAAELFLHLTETKRQLDRAIGGAVEEQRRRLLALERHRALAGPGYQLRLRAQRLDELRSALDAAIAVRVESATRRWAVARERLAARSPALRLPRLRERVDQALRAVVAGAGRRQRREGERLAALAGRLESLSPLAVIARGYSVVRRRDRTLIRSIADAPAGTHIQARLPDGWIEATVDGARPQRLNEPEAEYRV